MKYGNIIPRDYQIEAHKATAEHIRNYTGPAVIDATVGAGKSLLIAMLCHRAQEVNWRVLVLSRQSEIVEQDAEELWGIGVKNSIFSASAGVKSTAYPIIVGSEGTVARALDGDMAGFIPNLLLVDEAHMVNFDDQESQYMKIIAEMQKRNPQLRVFGYTGSPFRGVEPIIGDFWKKTLYRIDTETLVERGYLVPCVFGTGHDDVQYDLSKFASQYNDGTQDFTAAELKAMEKEIMNQGTRTHKIMLEVMHLTADRNCVMITGASKKHLEECSQYLPPNSFGIITDSTGVKKRREILTAAKEGKIKYLLQVGCLTTGLNIPLIDSIVILRKIGSLTLLVQLIGRGLRILKQDHIDAGYQKEDCMVLDYSDTMRELGQLYHSPMLEAAEQQRASKKGDVITCPKCYMTNSMFARRCIGEDTGSPDGRCEHFWQSRECPACGTENDIAARECRKCHGVLIDPNAKLTGKHYTEDDLKPVQGFNMRPTSNGEGVLVEYFLPDDEVATEIFWPNSDKQLPRTLWRTKFVFKHVRDRNWQKRALALRNAGQICGAKAMFDVPELITHRRNPDTKKSIIHRKVFRSGREETETQVTE